MDSEWCLQLYQQYTHMFRICSGWYLFNWTIDSVIVCCDCAKVRFSTLQTFKDHMIDGETLPLLSEEHLLDTLGLKLGPALKIRSQVKKHRLWLGLNLMQTQKSFKIMSQLSKEVVTCQHAQYQVPETLTSVCLLLKTPTEESYGLQ